MINTIDLQEEIIVRLSLVQDVSPFFRKYGITLYACRVFLHVL